MKKYKVMEDEELNDFTKKITKHIEDHLFGVIYDGLNENPSLQKNLNPAFPYPHTLRVGVLNNCFAVEFRGPSDYNDPEYETEGYFFPTKDIYDFLGLNIKHLNCINLAIGSHIENMTFFLGDSIDYLTDYFYDLTQLPSELIQLNGFISLDVRTEPFFVSNTTFFWTDEEGHLKIRHIDFLEIWPLAENGEISYHAKEGLEKNAQFILNYKVPTYRVKLHGFLNQFIELINQANVTETKITHFLTNNPEILQLAFGVNSLNPQVLLEWQYDSGKNDLKPDFLPVRMDGYADLMEFKLPHFKGNPIVGTPEREHPSFEIDAAIAQLDTYEEWCSQIVNTEWLEKSKGIKIFKPQRYLIIGHSKDFAKEDRAKLRSTRNTTVTTYDEFIEICRYQLYRVR